MTKPSWVVAMIYFFRESTEKKNGVKTIQMCRTLVRHGDDDFGVLSRLGEIKYPKQTATGVLIRLQSFSYTDVTFLKKNVLLKNLKNFNATFVYDSNFLVLVLQQCSLKRSQQWMVLISPTVFFFRKICRADTTEVLKPH